MNIIENIYLSVKKKSIDLSYSIIPFFRRILRFIALPYAYLVEVNWKECSVSKYQVFKDFLYIFFVLKDYPEHYTELRLRIKNIDEWKYYYGSIYNPYQRKYLRKEVQKKEYEILFEDKYVCSQLCSYANLPIPKFLAYVEPKDDINNIVDKLLNDPKNQKIIIKDNRGRGGSNIFVAYKRNNSILLSNSKNEFELSSFKLKSPSIIQRYIKQHPKVAKISPSINTVRTETLLTKHKKVIILGALMRFGLSKSYVDNFCVGGLTIGINTKNGTLLDFAINNEAKKFYNHPDTGFKFLGFKIPYWNEILELSKQIQYNFSYFKFLGPDIAITPDGPITIEINATPDHVGIEMNSGPIFQDKVIWEEFKKYDLLINNVSKNLY